jgi:hypothetical protein
LFLNQQGIRSNFFFRSRLGRGRNLFFRSRQGRGIVYDVSVADNLDAITVPFLLLIPWPGVEAAAIDILADDSNRLP